MSDYTEMYEYHNKSKAQKLKGNLIDYRGFEINTTYGAIATKGGLTLCFDGGLAHHGDGFRNIEDCKKVIDQVATIPVEVVGTQPALILGGGVPAIEDKRDSVIGGLVNGMVGQMKIGAD